MDQKWESFSGDLSGMSSVWGPPDPVASVCFSKEMCDQQNAFTMCPLCDKSCDYWNLSSACGTARASHLFDNPATVFFSIFMALWGKWLWLLALLMWVVLLNGYSGQALMTVFFSLLPLAFSLCISKWILGSTDFSPLSHVNRIRDILMLYIFFKKM